MQKALQRVLSLALGLALLVGFPLRMLAIVYKIEMPKFIYDSDMRR